MIRARDIFTQIQKLTYKLIESGLATDQCSPTIRRLSNSQREEVNISDIQSESSSIFLKKIPYKTLYYELLERRFYNIKMIDGALIQMQYIFSNNKIERHRLSFFPNPDLYSFQDYPDVYLEDKLYSDIVDVRLVCVPLRFDYDASRNDDGEMVAKPIVHPVSHLTIGQYKNCRIPVKSALTPYQFIEFIVRNFYNTDAVIYTNCLEAWNKYFEESIFEEEKAIINISIPVY